MSYMTKSTRMQKNDMQGKVLVLFSGFHPLPVIGTRFDQEYLAKSEGVPDVDAFEPPASWFWMSKARAWSSPPTVVPSAQSALSASQEEVSLPEKLPRYAGAFMVTGS